MLRPAANGHSCAVLPLCGARFCVLIFPMDLMGGMDSGWLFEGGLVGSRYWYWY